MTLWLYVGVEGDPSNQLFTITKTSYGSPWHPRRPERLRRGSPGLWNRISQRTCLSIFRRLSNASWVYCGIKWAISQQHRTQIIPEIKENIIYKFHN